MAFQKEIRKRPMYNAAGTYIGSEAALASGVPGERADMAPTVAAPFTTTAAVKYGQIANGGLVVHPKEGVRYGGSFADGLDVAVGTVVAVATKGHFWVELVLDSKAAIAKGATLEASTTGGGALSVSATPGTAGSNKTIYAKVLDGIAYTAPVAESGTPGADGYVAPVAEKGAEQFREVTVGASTKYAVIVKVELV